LSQELVEQVLARLGFGKAPEPDLAGLNRLYAAACCKFHKENTLKRIWFAGDRRGPLPGGEPVNFFDSWLRYGTGGTCFPINGGFCSLLNAIGFKARRISGAVDNGGNDIDANHGSVVVQLDGHDYLADVQIGSFSVLPLNSKHITSTGKRLHGISSEPSANSFTIAFHPGPRREQTVIFRTDPRYDPVDHQFFVKHYELSASSTQNRSRFNDSLFACKRKPEAMLIVGRLNRFDIGPDNTVRKKEITEPERSKILVEEFGIAEEVVEALPPDEDKGFSII